MKYDDIHKKAKEEKRMNKVTPLYVEWKKVGMTIVGQYIAAAAIRSTRGDGYYNQYLFHTDQGLVKFALGTATDKEITPVIRSGQVYSLEYKGKEKLKGGNEVNKFVVLHIDLTEDELSELEMPVPVSQGVEAAFVGGSRDKAF